VGCRVKRTTISFENSIGALTPETFLRLLSRAVYLRETGCSATQEMRDTIGDRTIESVHHQGGNQDHSLSRHGLILIAPFASVAFA